MDTTSADARKTSSADVTGGPTKRCSRCEQVLPVSAFHRRAHYSKDGTRSACRECTSIDAKRRREEADVDRTADEAKKSAVRSRTRRAIEQGVLVPQSCEDCDCTEVEAHHKTYDGDDAHLQVRWLCKRHHALLHGARMWTNQLELRLSAPSQTGAGPEPSGG